MRLLPVRARSCGGGVLKGPRRRPTMDDIDAALSGAMCGPMRQLSAHPRCDQHAGGRLRSWMGAYF